MADPRIARWGFAAAVGLSAMLAGCGGAPQQAGAGGGGGAPTPTPTATTASFDVLPCFSQVVPGSGSTLGALVVPDTLTINLAQPSGFPNGRRLQDPVIDITLAAIFLDLRVHAPDTLARLPLNPAANDVPFRTQFPYIAPPQGAPPLSGTDAPLTYAFVDQPASAFVRVDRMGKPAVATALIGSSMRNAYNEANPLDDANGIFVTELANRLKIFATALDDDFRAAGYTPCAVRQ